MKQVRRATAGTKITDEQYNQLVDATNVVLRMMVGPGLELRRVSGGMMISLAPPQTEPITSIGGGQGSWPEPDPDAYRYLLGETQGQLDGSTWMPDPAHTMGVEVDVITDIKYDTATGELTYRTRRLAFDPWGRLLSITMEGPQKVVTTAVECP